VRARILILVAVLTALVAGVCCRSTGEVNWEAVSAELHLTSLDAMDAADLVTDQALSDRLLQLSELLEAASAATANPTGTDARAAIHAALDLADTLAGELEGQDGDTVRLVVFAARSALRRWETYLPPPEPAEGPG